MKTCFFYSFFLFVLILKPVYAFADGFFFENYLSRQLLESTFKTNEIIQIQQIASAPFNRSGFQLFDIKTTPLFAGVEEIIDQVFYGYYFNQFKKGIHFVTHDQLKKPADIAITSKGFLLTIDHLEQLVVGFQIETSLKQASVAFTEKTDGRPIKIKTNGINTAYILTDSSKIRILENFHNIPYWNVLKSEQINTFIHDKIVIDLTVTAENDCILLTTEEILWLDNKNHLKNRIPLPKTYSAIDHTAYKDIVLLDSQLNTLTKYHLNGDKLAQQLLDPWIDRATDISIHRPYGLIGINGKTEGLVLSQGTAISEVRLEKFMQNKDQFFYHISFTLPMISKISVTISTDQSSRILLENDILPSGKQSIYWDGKDSSGNLMTGSISIKVAAVATYSKANHSFYQLEEHL